jgi:hypothetical protein
MVWEMGSVFFNKMLKKVTVNEPSQTDIDAEQSTSSGERDREGALP